MSIQRYDGDAYDIELEEKEDGIYVLYSDHVAAVDEARRDERRIFWEAEKSGYEQGLTAAREAVAKQQLHPDDQDDTWSSLTHVVVIQTALAAIDALRGES